MSISKSPFGNPDASRYKLEDLVRDFINGQFSNPTYFRKDMSYESTF